MTETVFVRGAGGALFEMDVPTAGHALERYEEAIRKGDLSVVPHAEWVERADGSRHLVVPPPAEDDDTPERAPSKPAKPAAKASKAAKKAAAKSAEAEAKPEEVEPPAADDTPEGDTPDEG